MSGLGIKATAPREVREILTGKMERVDGWYARLERPGEFRRSWERDEIVKQICVNEFDRIDSPSLRMEKLVHIKGSVIDRDGRGREQVYKYETKGWEIQAVVDCFNRKRDRSLKRKGLTTTGFRMELRGPLIINQAGGVLENAGLLLHRVFGVPYIPGSALKGCARHLAWRRWFEEGNEARKQQLALQLAYIFGFPTGDNKNSGSLDGYLSDNFGELFGPEGKFSSYAGAVAFLAAFPEGDLELAIDILSCHHMKYYGGDERYLQISGGKALDNEDPNPQPFPVVKEGAVFGFEILPVRRRGALPDEFGLSADFNAMDFAWFCLKTGLKEYGIGAKTASGYGWFQPLDGPGEGGFIQEASPAKINDEALPAVELSPEEQEAADFRRYDLRNLDLDKMLRLIDDLENMSPVKQKTFSFYLLENPKGKNCWQELKGRYHESLKRFNERGKNRFKIQAEKALNRINKMIQISGQLGANLPGV